VSKRVLTEQLVIRMPSDLVAWLERDAEENGRTVAQSVRWHLRRGMEVASICGLLADE
jgi:hypothetical protein